MAHLWPNEVNSSLEEFRTKSQHFGNTIQKVIGACYIMKIAIQIILIPFSILHLNT